MKRLMHVVAVVAAFAAVPAFADDSYVIPGSDRDPFSQRYTGRDPDAPSAERASAKKDDHAKCDRSCACGHDAATHKSSKA